MKTKLTVSMDTELMLKMIAKKKELGIPISVQVNKAVENYLKA